MALAGIVGFELSENETSISEALENKGRLRGVTVTVAGTWILVAGFELYEISPVERWTLWQKRFEEEASKSSVAYVRAKALAAVQHMDVVEVWFKA